MLVVKCRYAAAGSVYVALFSWTASMRALCGFAPVADGVRLEDDGIGAATAALHLGRDRLKARAEQNGWADETLCTPVRPGVD